MTGLTALFEERYAEVAAWARGLFDDAAAGFDGAALGAAKDAILAARGDEKRLRRAVYEDVWLEQAVEHVVPVCYGLFYDEYTAMHPAWMPRGLYQPAAVAAFLMGTGIENVGMTDLGITLALASAKIDYEPPETPNDAQDGEKTDFDPLKPSSWLRSRHRLEMALRPPEAGLAPWAVSMQGVWAAMALRFIQREGGEVARNMVG